MKNSALLDLVPTHNGPDEDYLVGDTIARTRQTLSVPTITDDAGDYKPRIGIVVEVLPHLVCIKWDGYPHAWDYAKRELVGTTRRLSRHCPVKIKAIGYRHPVAVAYKNREGWLTTDSGEWIAPHAVWLG